MTKQGELYRFILWLNEKLHDTDIGSVQTLDVSPSEYFKQYTVHINNKVFVGDETVVKDKLINYVITELVNRIT